MPIQTEPAGGAIPRGFDYAVILPAVRARLVAVSGDPQPLGATGFDAVESDRMPAPLVAVASATQVDQALATGAETLLLEGPDVRRRLGQAGRAVTRYLALPDPSNLEILLPLEQPVAVRYALRHWRYLQPGTSPQGRYMKAARNALIGRLSRSLPALGDRPLLTVATGKSTIPEAVGAASRLVGQPLAAWLPTFTGTHTDSRSVLQLFMRGEREPSWVIKLGRTPDRTGPFAHEEAALTSVNRTGGALAKGAPRFIGRMLVGDRPASVETAATGTRLDRLLAGPGSRRSKLQLLETVVTWLEDVARETLAPPVALEGERSRLAEEVVPFWEDAGETAELVRGLPPLPAVFVHGDLWEQNIVVGRRGFTALDWELARPDGFPLWDLIRFASLSLGPLDGAHSVEQRGRHFIELWSGRAQSSPILFRWLHRAAEIAQVPAEAVPAIVTLRWLDDPGRGRFEPPPSPARLLDRLPWLWLTEPRLGLRWEAWRGAHMEPAARER